MPRGKRPAESLLAGRQWVVIHDDCLDVVRRLTDGSVDVGIHDPPYNERTHTSAMTAAKSTSTTRTTSRVGERPGMLPIDFAALTNMRHVRAMLRVTCRWSLAFCALEMLGTYERTAGDAWIRAGIWRLRNPAPQFSGDRPGQPAEGIAIMHPPGKKRWNSGGKAAFYDVGVEHTDRCHPTQKDLRGIIELVHDYTEPGDLVLDMYAGSGTTGVACLRTGRRFIGIERDDRYAAIARERLTAEEQGLSLAAARARQVPLFGASA